jgi:lysophospholipase L1-like esterase
MFPKKTSIALVTLTLAAFVAPLAPALSWMRPPGLDTLARIVAIPSPFPEAKPVVPPPAVKAGNDAPKVNPPTIGDDSGKPKSTARHGVNGQPSGNEGPDLPIVVPGGELPTVTSPTEILDPTGIMRSFYEALQRSETKTGGAKVLHYGDSPVTADSITADARSLFQRQFGDAGHGFILAGKPWNWYQHRGTDVKSSGWKMEALSQAPRAKDNLHGLGGVNFEGAAGATSRIRLADATHNRVEVLYLKQPGGGEFRVEAKDTAILTIQTDAPEKGSGFAVAELPPGTSEIKLTVVRGPVRVFGYEFEKQRFGVVYSSLGLNGASTQSLLRFLDAGHWAEQIQHQKPDLLVLNYGTNESVFPRYVDTLYAGELRQVLARMKAAAPHASILVMAPMDRGEKSATGGIVTPPVMARIVAVQRQVAGETGCAFFNTYEAMGGAGTMAKWYAAKPRLVNADYIHPLPGGAAIVGGLLNDAIMQGYRNWKAGGR